MTTQAGVHEQSQQALLGYEAAIKATEQQITDTGNDGCPTTRTRANPCDVAVEQSALTVQFTELEQLRQREATHLVKMKQEYKVIIVVLCCSVFRPAITKYNYIHVVYNYSANNYNLLKTTLVYIQTENRK